MGSRFCTLDAAWFPTQNEKSCEDKKRTSQHKDDERPKKQPCVHDVRLRKTIPATIHSDIWRQCIFFRVLYGEDVDSGGWLSIARVHFRNIYGGWLARVSGEENDCIERQLGRNRCEKRTRRERRRWITGLSING
jgi:hypothetical protein